MQPITRSTPASATVPVVIPPFLPPEREGALAARVIGEVLRQDYAPAYRVSTFLCFMAKGRRAEWKAWKDTLQRFGGSMFQHPFIALADAVGLDEANERIAAFGTAFAASFEHGLDQVTEGVLPGSPFSQRDHERMSDWLRLLEKVDESLPILDQMYGPRKRAGLFGRPRWVAPGTTR